MKRFFRSAGRAGMRYQQFLTDKLFRGELLFALVFVVPLVLAFAAYLMSGSEVLMKVTALAACFLEAPLIYRYFVRRKEARERLLDDFR